MNLDFLTYALLGALAIGLIFSVYSDIRYRLIYNKVTLPIALASPLYWFATGQLNWTSIGIHLLIGFCVLVVFAIFFAMGMMGGGDVKLLVAFSLWFDWIEVIRMIFHTSLIGGLVTIIFLIIHKSRKQQGKVRIPYGVAIAVAGLSTVGTRFLNHFG